MKASIPTDADDAARRVGVPYGVLRVRVVVPYGCGAMRFDVGIEPYNIRACAWSVPKQRHCERACERGNLHSDYRKP